MIEGEEYDCLSPSQRYKRKLKAKRDAERGPQPTREEKHERTLAKRRVNQKAYAERDPARAKEIAARSRDKHRDKRNAEARAWRATPEGGAYERERERAAYAAKPTPKRSRSTAYYRANKERVQAVQKAWAKANPDKVKAKEKRWRERNREKVNATARAWHAANKETRNAKRRERRAARKAESAD